MKTIVSRLMSIVPAALVALHATSAAARTVSVASVGETGAALLFGDADGKAYQLAVCYGDEDGGATTAGWDTCEILGAIGAAETSRTVALPAGWGSTVTHLRYFLLTRPYAADLEFIGTSNKNTPAGVYFDSGVKARDGTRMVAELMVYSDSGNKEFCGTQKGSDYFRLYGVNGTGQRLGYCGSGASINGSSYPIDKTSLFKITTTLAAGSQSISCQKSTNGGSSWSSYGSRTDTQAGPVDWNLNLFILAINHDGVAEYEAAMKLYALALYSDGNYTTPVRDFVPVLDENGVACLYDKMTGGFFYNQGTSNPTQGTATAKAYDVVAASSATVTSAPRSVTVLSTSGGSATLAFGAADGKAYQLAVCYGDEDGGADTNAWDSFEILGAVGAAETSRAVALPAGWGGAVKYVRYFLLSRTYAAGLEFIGTDSKNTPAHVFFDSGVKAKDGTKMVAELMVYSDSGNKEFCGAQNGSDVFRLYGVNGKTQRLGYCGSGATINASSYPIDKTSRFKITTTLDAGSQSISCQKSTNGGSTWSSYGSRTDTQAGPVDWDLNLYILAANSNGAAIAEAAMKLYTLALYSDGDYTTPVRDFVPVLDENGVACLYDKVTGGFFYNQGASNPTHGTATTKALSVASSSETADCNVPVARLAYVQSDGADDFLNLGVIARDGTKMVAEMEWLSTSGAPVFCGAATNTSNGLFWLYGRNSTTQRMGYLGDAATINGSSYPVASDEKYRITTTLDAGAQTVACERQIDGAWATYGSRSTDTSGPLDTGLPLYLFADNVNGTAEAFSKARLYSLKLWQKDGNGDYQLVRYLVPAKTPDGEAALWDRVGEIWFRNGGTGALSAGAESPWSSGLVIGFW
ncbi:MAG: hypothetical protein IKH04_02185 [Kiritimatiellae bacterium]|nr:hypothetical protein [Kiritimatiellia bacterium]